MRLSEWSTNVSLPVLALAIGGGYLSLDAHAVPMYDSVSIPLTLTTIAMPCTVDAPAVVQLGIIKNKVGDMHPPPFDVKVNCTAPLQTEVFAQTLTPLLSGSKNSVVMTGEDSLVQFWLDYNSAAIRLDGDTNITDSGFCEGTNTRTCVLTPGVRVMSGVVPGVRTATIQLNVRYKA